MLDENAVTKAHAVYTPFTLAIYDMLVHGLSNRFAWRCPTQRLVELYRENLSPDHLEAGVGTGLLLDRAATPKLKRLVLLDANRNCLDRAAQRLARFKPEPHQVNLLAPLALRTAPVASIGLTYLLHCLPGRMDEKLKAIDHLRLLMRDGEGSRFLFRMAKGFDVMPNRRRARVTETIGEIVAELDGAPENLERGIRYMEQEGVLVEAKAGECYSEPIAKFHRGHNPHPELPYLCIGLCFTSPDRDHVTNSVERPW